MKRSKAQKSSRTTVQEVQSDSENEEVYDLTPIDDGPDEADEDPVLNDEEEDTDDILDMPSLADSESGEDEEEEEFTGSEDEESIEGESTNEKGIRVFRRTDRPEIEPDYHSDSSDEVIDPF
jgi:hypothetical protein